MSHPQPPQRQPTSSETEKYIQTIHYAAVVTVIACPVLALLPPRKLDFYTLGLIGTTVYSGNYLLKESSGRSILQHLGGVPATTPGYRMPSINTSAVGEVQRQNRVGLEQSDSLQAHRDAWKLQREREIKQDVEEGKGFADMIIDQIWEVWNWGKPKEDDED